MRARDRERKCRKIERERERWIGKREREKNGKTEMQNVSWPQQECKIVSMIEAYCQQY